MKKFIKTYGKVYEMFYSSWSGFFSFFYILFVVNLSNSLFPDRGLLAGFLTGLVLFAPWALSHFLDD